MWRAFAVVAVVGGSAHAEPPAAAVDPHAPLARCATGDWRACEDVRGIVFHETAAERAQYTRECTRGAAASCAFLGDWIFEHDLTSDGKAGDPLPWYRRACTSGSQYGCERLAWSLPDKSAEAIRIYEHLCKHDWAPACGAAAYRLGSDTPATKARGHALYARACDLGELDGCWQEGLDLAYDKTSTDEARARSRDRMDAACAAHNADSCRALDDVYRCGLGTACDPARASRYAALADLIEPPRPMSNDDRIGGPARCHCKE